MREAVDVVELGIGLGGCVVAAVVVPERPALDASVVVGCEEVVAGVRCAAVGDYPVVVDNLPDAVAHIVHLLLACASEPGVVPELDRFDALHRPLHGVEVEVNPVDSIGLDAVFGRFFVGAADDSALFECIVTVEVVLDGEGPLGREFREALHGARLAVGDVLALGGPDGECGVELACRLALRGRSPDRQGYRQRADRVGQRDDERAGILPVGGLFGPLNRADRPFYVEGLSGKASAQGGDGRQGASFNLQRGLETVGVARGHIDRVGEVSLFAVEEDLVDDIAGGCVLPLEDDGESGRDVDCVLVFGEVQLGCGDFGTGVLLVGIAGCCGNGEHGCQEEIQYAFHGSNRFIGSFQ